MKSLPTKSARKPFFCECSRPNARADFLALIRLLNIKEPERAKKSARVVFLQLSQKKRSAGRLAGRLFFLDCALDLNDASCRNDGAPRRLHLSLQCVHIQICSGAWSLRPNFQKTCFSVWEHVFVHRAFCCALSSCMFTSLFPHTWISIGVNLSQPSGAVWPSSPHLVSLAKHFFCTLTCVTPLA